MKGIFSEMLISGRANCLLLMITINTTKKIATMTVILPPQSNTIAPTIDIINRDRKSVMRSAKIIGAVLLIESPVISFTRTDFRTSPSFAGVTLIISPDIKVDSESIFFNLTLTMER